jgi:hypothetical protein
MKKAYSLTAAVALALAAGAAWWSAKPSLAPESTFVLLDGSHKTSSSPKARSPL